MSALKEKSVAVAKIENAFIELLKENSPDDMTVTQIIKKANVGKSTFYRYYKDVFDVFDVMLDDFLRRALELFELMLNDFAFLNEIKSIFNGNASNFSEISFSKNDETLLYYSLKSTDSVVINRFVQVISDRLCKFYIYEKNMEENRASIYSRFVTYSLTISCIHSNIKGQEINFDEYKYVSEISKILLPKGDADD